MSTTRHVIDSRASHAQAHADGCNGLLAALSADAYALLKPHLHDRDLPKGSLLWAAGHPLEHIYFPLSGLISVAMPIDEGRSIEVGSVSREGAIGVYDTLGNIGAIASGMVRIAGRISVIPARRFREALRQSEELAALAACGCEWILLQAQLTAACNATHGADARFCRWLLSASARTDSDLIPMTQDELAGVLGIRRTTVTLMAQKLQRAGTIRYSRGKVVILNRKALEGATCSCWKFLGRERWPSTRLHTLANNRHRAAAD
jgi:CRP-like cAMP-binding protein